MSKTKEIKVAEDLVNLTEDHWFNPAILARYLTDQPFYTVDRIMELVAQIIRWQANRHNDELNTEDGIYNSGAWIKFRPNRVCDVAKVWLQIL